MTKLTQANEEGDQSDAEFSYGAAIAELEQILSELESNNVEVDDLATRVKRADSLILLCQAKLHAAEVQIEHVVDPLDIG